MGKEDCQIVISIHLAYMLLELYKELEFALARSAVCACSQSEEKNMEYVTILRKYHYALGYHVTVAVSGLTHCLSPAKVSIPSSLCPSSIANCHEPSCPVVFVFCFIDIPAEVICSIFNRQRFTRVWKNMEYHFVPPEERARDEKGNLLPWGYVYKE